MGAQFFLFWRRHKGFSGAAAGLDAAFGGLCRRSWKEHPTFSTLPCQIVYKIVVYVSMHARSTSTRSLSKGLVPLPKFYQIPKVPGKPSRHTEHIQHWTPGYIVMPFQPKPRQGCFEEMNVRGARKSKTTHDDTGETESGKTEMKDEKK